MCALTAGERGGNAHRESSPAAQRFDAETRIAEVSAADPSFVERLIALHPALAVIGDVNARQTAARLVTLGDAAGISGLPLECILAAASPVAHGACGFVEVAREETEVRPAWMDRFDASAAVTIDVRSLIATGGCPFRQVMGTVARVPVGGGLVIEAPFNPLPLRRVLGDKGFDTAAERLGSDHWRICCLRKPAEAVSPRGGDAAAAGIWRSDDGVHIDVRGMEAPAPLVNILRLIDSCEHDGVVIVHHRRQPVYLLPELAERGWSWEQVSGEPGEVRLVLRRDVT